MKIKGDSRIKLGAKPFINFGSTWRLWSEKVNTASGCQEAKEKVLLVDDDPVTLTTTSFWLTAAGYNVTTTTDPAEAIERVGQEKPDVILLDVNFPPDVAHGGGPAWDGLRLMYWLRGLQNTSGSRFILISAEQGVRAEKLRQRALADGAAEFLSKPLDHQHLLAAVRTQPSANAAVV
jgi:CheY-like chemotaxis protein